MHTKQLTDTIIAFWERATGEDGLTPEDNFFDLGGDSLTAATILALVQREYGLEAELSLIFDNPTVEEFVEALDEKLTTAPHQGADA
ncbi:MULTISPECIES: acyl carrier protein [Streptomyces]|uniref:acyl carrier protein n=1 Tax=Streptomyces TaxID=1883 RepID=UPI00081B1942|nr:acyl carrier protein [Streptomyces sp. DvalAA-19]SCE40160.1 Phosphopantetheine attachment site [Streptomyces sp. DvalAA-19]